MEFDLVLRRVRNEFLEMPGLRVTVQQAMRLWGLERTACEAVIDSLLGSAFLRRTQTGTFVRADG